MTVPFKHSGISSLHYHQLFIVLFIWLNECLFNKESSYHTKHTNRLVHHKTAKWSSEFCTNFDSWGGQIPTQSVVSERGNVGMLILIPDTVGNPFLDPPPFHQLQQWRRVTILLNPSYGLSHKWVLRIKPSPNYPPPSIASHSTSYSHPSPNTSL